MNLSKLVIGLAGISVVNVAPVFVPPTGEEWSTIVQIIVSIIIGIGTIIGIFKKDKGK